MYRERERDREGQRERDGGREKGWVTLLNYMYVERERDTDREREREREREKIGNTFELPSLRLTFCMLCMRVCMHACVCVCVCVCMCARAVPSGSGTRIYEDI